jgi:glycosyltransferase involved in cell wall biosynthesis
MEIDEKKTLYSNNTFNNKENNSNFSFFNNEIKKPNLKNYYCLYILLISIFLVTKIIDKYRLHKPKFSLEPYIKYIKDCKKLKYYERKKIINEKPYISVCIPALNMQEYMEKTILSILNQSFQNFEIIVVNDFSTDETENILKRLREKDERVKYINHPKNLGVYAARTEAIIMAKGQFIILMDPDDMFLNGNLFQELYDYNLKYNLDIIEFKVYHQDEGTTTIYSPDNHLESHYHNFPKEIIHQPELSDLLFYNPGTKEYNKTICRNIWNKMIRKEPLLKMIDYIGYDYFHNYLVITADDMLMNIITYHFAQNYSNIDLPGYLYNIRKVSMSRGNGGIELSRVRAINHYLYFTTFYRYVKEFDKDRNFIFYDLKDLQNHMKNIKECADYIPKTIDFLNEIIRDKKSSLELKDYARELISFYNS